MIYLILIIFILKIILYFVYKDYLKLLKISSVISSISALFTFITGYIIRFFINSNIHFINISKVSNIIFSKFLKNSMYLTILSIMEICLYLVIYNYKEKRKVIA